MSTYLILETLYFEEYIENIMKRCNRDFVVKHSKEFAKVLNKILEIKAPILFHCSFGKDRTGFATAMILSIIGVSKEIIIEEYLFLKFGRLYLD